jgi:hypothetical protein
MTIMKTRPVRRDAALVEQMACTLLQAMDEQGRASESDLYLAGFTTLQIGRLGNRARNRAAEKHRAQHGGPMLAEAA